MENQRPKENGSSNLLDTCQKVANYRKGVSQRRLGRKLGVSQVNLCRQISKIKISCYKREKTPKSSEKQGEKAKNLCKKLANLVYRSSVVWF